MNADGRTITSVGHWYLYTGPVFDDNGQLRPDIDRKNLLQFNVTLSPGHPLYQPPEIPPEHRNNPTTQHREIRICDFSKEDPVAWFEILEKEFSINNVSREYEKYQILMRHLDFATIENIKDCGETYHNMKKELLCKSFYTRCLRIRDGAYDAKQELEDSLRYCYNYCSDGYGNSIRELLELYEKYIELDLKLPSRIWAEMRKDEALDNYTPEKALEILWFFLLPYETRDVLQGFKTSTIDEWIECADLLARNWKPKVLPNQPNPQTLQLQALTNQIQELETQSEVISHPLKLCYYHKRFKRKARKCKAPCAAAQGSSTVDEDDQQYQEDFTSYRKKR